MVTHLNVAVFTRDQPVTKVELHNAFFRDGKYQDTSVVAVRAVIGLNSPKYMVREGFMSLDTSTDVDMYRLTDSGRDWLAAGLKRYLELHPDRARDCVGRTIGKAPKPPATRPIRRTRP